MRCATSAAAESPVSCRTTEIRSQESAAAGEVKIEIELHSLRSKRLTTLDEAEFELLKTLPGMNEW